ncbi:hypothetical protein I547_2506 [Mycobacterium kansasii 824]|nr:hypothetical protein I547_2506 [Mycobacterium kansasii 824]
MAATGVCAKVRGCGSTMHRRRAHADDRCGGERSQEAATIQL